MRCRERLQPQLRRDVVVPGFAFPRSDKGRLRVRLFKSPFPAGLGGLALADCPEAGRAGGKRLGEALGFIRVNRLQRDL